MQIQEVHFYFLTAPAPFSPAPSRPLGCTRVRVGVSLRAKKAPPAGMDGALHCAAPILPNRIAGLPCVRCLQLESSDARLRERTALPDL